MRARRSACEETSRSFMYPDSTAAIAPPSACTRSISARAPSTSSATFAATTCEPSKMSSYSSRSDSKASTCWSRSDHCWSHGPRQAEGLVPRGQLDGAGAGVLAQRHAEHLQHDPLHVVLGLRLGEAERVDLDAVPEPAHLRVGHAVPLLGQLVPQLHEGAHLAHLLDEPHAGVDEERHPADDLAEVLLATPGRTHGPCRGRRSRCTARTPAPAPASRRPPGGGSCRC